MLQWVAAAPQATCIASAPPMLVELHLIVKFPSDIHCTQGVLVANITCAGLFYCMTNNSAFSVKSSMIFAV